MSLIDEMWDEWTTCPADNTFVDAECAGLLSGLLSERKSFNSNSAGSNDTLLRPRHLRVSRRLLKLWRRTAWFARWNIADELTLPQESGERVTIHLPAAFRDELVDLARSMAKPQVSQQGFYSSLHHASLAIHWAWLRGLWGSCGGLYLPKSGYYLVMRVSSRAIAEPLHDVLQHTGLPWHERTHFGAQEMTLRDVESIVTFLCNLGLSAASLELESRSIVRSMRDQANRVRNCDTANIKRTLPVAKEQVKLAMFIAKSGLLSRLPAPMRELVEVRLANPEASLTELGEKLSQPITKSSVRYKWGRLRDYVSNLSGQSIIDF